MIDYSKIDYRFYSPAPLCICGKNSEFQIVIIAEDISVFMCELDANMLRKKYAPNELIFLQRPTGCNTEST